VPLDLVGRVEYAIRFMPWPLVIFVVAVVAGGIGVAYAFEPSALRSVVVKCPCGRREAEVIGCSDRVSAAVVRTVTEACPGCTPLPSLNRQSTVENRQSARRAL